MPSSQYPAVGITTIPSPHISPQLLAVIESPNVQLQLVSTVQVDDHPSPLLVLPSSQIPTVGTITIPSPHISVQGVVEQSYPVSTVQVELHPSPLIKFPSSQTPIAETTTTPSPHISVQKLAVVESPNVQLQLVSTPQEALHPSPDIVFPSSQ